MMSELRYTGLGPPVDPGQCELDGLTLSTTKTTPLIKVQTMPLFNIHLSLARSSQAPHGDPNHYYEFRAPLDKAGHLDQSQWPQSRQFCVVAKHEQGIATEKGLLLNTGGGKWVFSYRAGDADDESIFRLSSHVFMAGEYVSITEHDGVQRTFHVDSVEPWHPTTIEGVKAARWPSTRA